MAEPSEHLQPPDDERTADRGTFALLLLCFFLSGLAALIYQTAWTRRFAFVFGTSELAVATVLAAYMAGLAVGAAVAARYVDRVRRPVLVYGVLEAAIALSALAVPFALQGADALHAMLFAVADAPPPAGEATTAIFYLVSAFLVLVVPTALMGATLPLLAREAIHRQQDVGPRIALLYAMNTLGAVFGTLLAGFWLLSALGLSGTVFVAVAANFAVFAAASVVGLRGQASGPPAQSRSTRTHAFVNRWVLPVMLVSGSVSFSYEVLWTRLLGQVLGGSVHAFATMLASFLTGIALGSALASRWSRDAVTAGRALIVCQVGIGLLSLAAFFGMDALPELSRAMGARGTNRLMGDAIASMLVLLPSTTLLGATFPLAVRLYAKSEDSAAPAAARVYAWNTLGGIIGAVGAGFFLIPALGFSRALALAVGTNLVLAAVIALRAPLTTPGATRSRRALAVAAGGITVALLIMPPPTPWRLLRTAPLGLQTASGDLVFDAVGRGATVTVLKRAGALHLATNGLPEAVVQPPGARTFSHRVSQWLGAGPGLARPEMRTLLAIGLGGGVLLERVPSFVEEVHVIELEQEVLEANRFMAAQRGTDPLSDPRVRVVVNDARGALVLTDRRFDAIVSQPSHPWTAGASHLYTREFFELVADHLEPGGVFVQWMGLAFIDEALLEVLVATLQAVFENVTVHQPQAGGVVFFASNAPIDLERSGPLAIASDPDLYRAMGLRDDVDLAAHLVLDTAGARRVAERGEVGTDERNLLQMRSPAVVRSRQGPLRIDTTAIETAACDSGSPARTPSLELVRALIAFGHGPRAMRCASAITDPTEKALASAMIAAARRDPKEQRSELQRALSIDPDSVAARFGLLELQRPWQRPPRTSIGLEIEKLDASAQSVARAWSLERVRHWGGLSKLDVALGELPTDHPAYPAATRMRARWRVELGSEEQAREAIELLDALLMDVAPEREALLLRSRATLTAGLHEATVGTLFDFARSNAGPTRDIAQAREALAIEAKVDESAFAEGERARLRRALGARP